MTERLSADRAAVVDPEYHWIPISERQPQQGALIQLINEKHGVAARGYWTPSSEWTHWAPLPTFRRNTNE